MTLTEVSSLKEKKTELQNNLKLSDEDRSMLNLGLVSVKNQAVEHHTGALTKSNCPEHVHGSSRPSLIDLRMLLMQPGY